ncbi:glycerophosphoryl diester phosphodiesterase Gde1 [Schizosaccharomyces japonicus yFS275]|uniref:Glycerophosphoryl diester phosphodiesterase Gde1 n=1 Tax=Schizosaccharomyces japonicus (strain yFS275 / FY16936) TaxID=402676 RepID=B6JW52_SCHJY|nr:glycerophosphoryl diester phosphodiesterase Gde1 [Schizosaccharomyces japonicus yFS275]EEB05603.2 glycerophosphoryl diester phosphodiesterase Gde1 [Schizosaccharomyces japonicus yFS275]
MKFTESLHKAIVPQYADEYVDYEGIKRKLLAAATQLGESAKDVRNDERQAVLRDLMDDLHVNLDRVTTFYDSRISRMSLFAQRLQSETQSIEGSNISTTSRTELQKSLLSQLNNIELQLHRLSSYCEWNKCAFEKLARKLDKHFDTNAFNDFYILQTLTHPFAGAHEVKRTLKTVRSTMNTLKTEFSFRGYGSSPTSSSSGQSLDVCLEKDDSLGLFNIMGKAPAHLLSDVLTSCITKRAVQCTNLVLKLLVGDVDMIGRGFRHAVYSCKDKDAEVLETFLKLVHEQALHAANRRSTETKNESSSVNQQPHLVARLLSSKDSIGQTALHYVAKNGQAGLCTLFCRELDEVCPTFRKTCTWSSPEWRDVAYETPMSLAIRNCNVGCIDALTVYQPKENAKLHDTPTPTLVLACRLIDDAGVIEALVRAGYPVDAKDIHGSSAIHVATRFNHANCVQELLRLCPQSVTALEPPYDWTPLIIAAAFGLQPIVSILLEAGSDLTQVDSCGWTAMEHAAIRGHLDCAALLKTDVVLSNKPVTSGSLDVKPTNSDIRSCDRAMQIGVSDPNASVLILRLDGISGRVRVTVLDEGAEYLSGKVNTSFEGLSINASTSSLSSHSSDKRSPSCVINIPRSQFDNLGEVGEHYGNSLEEDVDDGDVEEDDVFEDNSPAPPTSHKQPVELLFKVASPESAVLHVDLLASRSSRMLAKAVCRISSLLTNVGAHMQSLKPASPLPMLSTKDMNVVRWVNVQALISTYSKAGNAISMEAEPPKALTSEPALATLSSKPSTSSLKHACNSSFSLNHDAKGSNVALIGHRGLGKNLPDRKCLQLGENTLDSLIAAGNLGASYVEFDVQMTKDLVPVVYHDFIVHETGVDAQIHSLTYQQFLSFSHQYPTRDVDETESSVGRTRSRSIDMPRPASFTLEDGIEPGSLSPNSSVYKGNSFGNSICGPFTTFKDILLRVPLNIGLNIELKYAMLSEAEEEGLEPVGIDANTYVDIILDMIHTHGKKRNFIFSSFNPDICILASLKQSAIPVLFLTEAGTAYRTDARAASLQQAINFSCKWGLLGIVSACQPIVHCPRLIDAVKQRDLACFTYGVLNNDAENVRRQVKHGVDAVIVDNVLAIRRCLNDIELTSSN